MRERLAGVPRFVRQIFYVHWIYIVIVLGLFAALCFGFARELAGASVLGRFLSGFMAAFWLLRIGLQIFYYDREVRRENRGLDMLYVGALMVLVVVFGMAATQVRVTALKVKTGTWEMVMTTTLEREEKRIPAAGWRGMTRPGGRG